MVCLEIVCGRVLNSIIEFLSFVIVLRLIIGVKEILIILFKEVYIF